MGRPHPSVLILIVFVMAVACTLCVSWPREPRCQGKRLSEWLAVVYPDDERARAQGAVRAIGKKAIPTLLGMVQATDSSLKLNLMSLAEKQSLVRIGFTSKDESRRDGAYGFRILGPEAKEALPELVRLFHDEDTALYAALAMSRIGPESVAILREGLTNQHLRVRIANAFALPEAGSNAWGVVPDLAGRLKDKDEHPDVCESAAYSLGELHLQADLVVPALIERLHDSDRMVCEAVAEALGKYGKQATSAVPALLKAMPSSDLDRPYLRKAITNALHNIDPSLDPDAAHAASSVAFTNLATSGSLLGRGPATFSTRMPCWAASSGRQDKRARKMA